MASYVKRMQKFFGETRRELKKVNWPTRRELMFMTGIVLIIILIIGAFFWVLDTVFTSILQLIIG